MEHTRYWLYKEKNPVSVIMVLTVFPILLDELKKIEEGSKESRILVTGEMWLD